MSKQLLKQAFDYIDNVPDDRCWGDYRDHNALKEALSKAIAAPEPEPLHDSDCSQHNMPAYPNEPCDCSIAPVLVCVERGRVWIKRGTQSFMLAYDADHDADAEWYAGQLRDALSILHLM